MDCLFCKIVNREIPAQVIYENDRVIAFLDINPVNPGHTLIIPKAHSRRTDAAEDNDLVALALALKKLAPIICSAVSSESWNLLAVGELVPHTHWHVIPRFKDDGLNHLPRKSYAAGQMVRVAEAIRAKLA